MNMVDLMMIVGEPIGEYICNTCELLRGDVTCRSNACFYRREHLLELVVKDDDV